MAGTKKLATVGLITVAGGGALAGGLYGAGVFAQENEVGDAIGAGIAPTSEELLSTDGDGDNLGQTPEVEIGLQNHEHTDSQPPTHSVDNVDDNLPKIENTLSEPEGPSSARPNVPEHSVSRPDEVSRSKTGAPSGTTHTKPATPKKTISYTVNSHKELSTGDMISGDASPLAVGNLDTFRSYEKPQYKGNKETFNLSALRCFHKFFPGATYSGNMNVEVNSTAVSSDFNTNSLLPYPSPGTALGKARACAAMDLKHRSYLFRFRSEIAMRDEKVGMVLWTGIKNTKGEKFHLSYLHITNYLLLLEKNSQGSWRVKMGYSWGSDHQDKRPRINELAFRFPNGKVHKINRVNITPQTQNKILTNTVSYAGVWEEDKSGKSYALTLESYPYYRRDNYYNPRYYNYDRTIDPTVINGYGDGVDVFYRPNDEKKWTKLQRGNRTVNLSVDSILEAWYLPFRVPGTSFWTVFGGVNYPLTGTWTDISTYCRGKEGILESLKKSHLCFDATTKVSEID